MSLRRDVLILVCAVSAGIHGALAPGHVDEGAGAEIAFVTSAVLLAGLALWLTLRPADRLASAAAAAAVVLAGLLGSYALATTTGVPILHPEPEPVGGLALAADASIPGLRAHLEGCPACREEHESLRALVGAEHTS